MSISNLNIVAFKPGTNPVVNNLTVDGGLIAKVGLINTASVSTEGAWVSAITIQSVVVSSIVCITVPSSEGTSTAAGTLTIALPSSIPYPTSTISTVVLGLSAGNTVPVAAVLESSGTITIGITTNSAGPFIPGNFAVGDCAFSSFSLVYITN